MSGVEGPPRLARRSLLAALAAGAVPALAAGAVPALAAPDGGDGVAPGRHWQWPRDHGAHPGARIEWWYLTGHLQAADAAAFGFQLTFFASRTGIASQPTRRLTPSHVLMAHAALTDLAGRRHLHDQRIARWGGAARVGAAQAGLDDTALQLGNWHLRRTGGAGLSHYQAHCASGDALGFALTLDLRASQSVLLQGEQGYSRKGGSAVSHYLSEPQLQASGRLRLGARQLAVTGRAWLDHEWSHGLLPAGAVGWDWLGINLDDGGALTAFRLRDAAGHSLWAGGSLRDAAGQLRIFAAHEVQFAALRHWTSPSTGARYPVAWRLHSPAGPQRLEALLEAQEMDLRATTGTAYWEGLSVLRAEDGRTLGHGYLEMTGYAGALRL